MCLIVLSDAFFGVSFLTVNFAEDLCFKGQKWCCRFEWMVCSGRATLVILYFVGSPSRDRFSFSSKWCGKQCPQEKTNALVRHSCGWISGHVSGITRLFHLVGLMLPPVRHRRCMGHPRVPPIEWPRKQANDACVLSAVSNMKSANERQAPLTATR